MSKIMKIERLRPGVDGAGICTLVCFHGCPLNCKYCINPQCHSDDVRTGNYGAEELARQVAVDDLYFKMTGGGVTFGGGEPLLYSDFILEFCRDYADPEWSINMETSLNAEWESVQKLIPFVDRWIVDIKDLDPEIYQRYTGAGNDKVLRNLELLAAEAGKERIIARVPLIPGFNTRENRSATLDFVESLADIVDLFEYIQTEEL